MSRIDKTERATQDRVIELFTQKLGYRYLGDWSQREGNHCIEEGPLTAHLAGQGYSQAHVSAALHRLRAEALLHGRTLAAANQAVYQLLRYGVSVKVAAGELSETVHLVNWDRPDNNDFAIAEEVTLKGGGMSGHERRPDIVLYLNGIAVGMLELKNSRVGLGEGIRQCLSNQRPEFNDWFFSTVQLVLAGNDSEGLRYGAIETQEKYFLTWKEDEADNAGYKLDKYLAKLCGKPRLLELMHDFVLFDGGVKKLPRVHQYFGIKAAQTHVQQRRGGIIWHTQGAGKSILMVLLARWILENRPAARVAIITDRDELDRQIERVFKDAGQSIHRSQSGRELMTQLAQPNPRLLCSLVHKFGRRDVDDFEAFLRELTAQPTQTPGEAGDTRLPSPNPVTNMVIADVVLRGAGVLLRRRVEKGLLTGQLAAGHAEKIVDKRGIVSKFALWGASRLATRSPLGLVVVAGGLAAKVFYDRGKRLEAKRGRRKRDKPES